MVTSFCSCLSRRFLSCFCPSVITSSSGGAISGLHLFFCSDRSIIHKTKIIINYFSELCHNQSVHLHIAIIAISIKCNQTLNIFKSITTCSETTVYFHFGFNFYFALLTSVSFNLPLAGERGWKQLTLQHVELRMETSRINVRIFNFCFTIHI